ncbi:MAG: DEAD/DEAH box helicase [Hyphomicrobiaceae bacterium]|nr:DEAD/DEAH box helicase [Hyphomicrobiaceae bacterium]
MAFPTTHPALARALAARGYDAPTAVQLAVLADDAAGRDQLVSAQTGSGKTVAFGLSLGATLLGADDQMPATRAPLALIVAPTRELAMQVCRELTWLYDATGARVITCVGGMDARAEARELSAGPHIVVGTPGRLRDHLERHRLDLSQLRAVVLDEADEMLDLGFREDLEFILDATPAERRTLLFSATLPRDIQTLAGRYQRDAVRIETLRRDEQHADIDYWAHRVVPHDVENTIVNVLRFHEARAALVFCATRGAVNRLNSRLVERGFSSVALSGELSQTERTEALQALRDGRARVLVATDVAARGLDLPDLALVIHAELPNDGETLLHRSGRTGRAGRKGLCVLIVPFNRRRKADAVIAAARLEVTWRPAPTASEVLARDEERLVADPSFTAPATDDDVRWARNLQLAHGAEAIALALIRQHRARLPQPGELAVDTGPPRREGPSRQREDRDASDRPVSPWKREGAAASTPSTRADRSPRRHHDDRPARTMPRDVERSEVPAAKSRRPDPRPMTWFKINIGRDRNADPRWLLPLVCRAGGVTKSEIGAIRIDERETRFEVLAEIADQFDYQARTAKTKEGHIVRVKAAPDGGVDTVMQTIEALAAPAPLPAADRRPDRAPPAARGPHAGKAHKAPWRERDKAANGGSGWAPRGRQGKKPATSGRDQDRSSAPAAAGDGKRPAKAAKKKPRFAVPAGGR